MNKQTNHTALIVSPLIVTAIMLFAALASMPGDYYTALKIIVTAASINSIIMAYRFKKKTLILFSHQQECTSTQQGPPSEAML